MKLSKIRLLCFHLVLHEKTSNAVARIFDEFSFIVYNDMAGPSKGIRLSFLAQADQSKYEKIFTQATKGNDILTASAAKEVLSRSNIGDENLARIWDLSNVTNAPQLTFPEFATAMYLTSMKMTGADIPYALPEIIHNELINAVRSIQSGINTQSMVPLGQQQQQPTPNFSNNSSFMLSSSSSPSQPTRPSYASSISNGSISMQATGVSSLSSSTIPTATASLPTASMPTGMLGNNLDFSNRMMPYERGSSFMPSTANFQTLSKSVKIPWAVTAEEKKQYKKIFNAWDTEDKGYITGEKAKEIFSQSGLPQNVLMQIWALADPHNAGKLNLDEFSVAMHLIYRKLNGYDVPKHLPPELIPPSTRDLVDSVSQLKQSILDNIAKKKNLANFSSSPSTSSDSLSNNGNVHRAYSSSSSLMSAGSSKQRTTIATGREKRTDDEDDKEVGYVSSARRMGPDRNRVRDADGNIISNSSSPASSYGYRGKQTRIHDLRKEIDEKKRRIQELENEAQPRTQTKRYDQLSALDKKEIDTLKERIRELQKEISKNGVDEGQGDDAWSTYINKTAELTSLAEQVRLLEEEIRFTVDHTLKGLLAQVDETENDLLEKKIQAAEAMHKSSTANNHTSNSNDYELPLNIVGTGPNGEITESDRIKAKAKAMVAARMNKLTGKGSNGGPTQTSSLTKFTAEVDKYKSEREEFKIYIDSITDSLTEVKDALQAIHSEISMIGLDIRKEGYDQKKIVEKGRFEHGENVAKDLKEFVQQLKYDASLAKQPEVDPTFESRFPSFA
ncbi:hypothetical protein BDF20DRAFT_858003 [Mycotypha africana]|uniref:uncharacterized protein n=1 Tax=Mycotypha africana TaxID=64632 RepID=UPI00230121C4|nr:uncharacterized protein BDF20DRAFT_858003 [Mycotypha africana]KAI8984113.1 hypothetical protein BDF20DRAFT_858003 [Mycotypha africana]